MSVLAAQPQVENVAVAKITPEEMLRLPDEGKLYELVDGRLVEKFRNDVAHLVANNLTVELITWARPAGAGRCLVGTTFRCFPHDPAMVRRPDVAYVSTQRFAGYTWGQAHFTITPDLAVEVASPKEKVLELDRRISDYLRAGVRRVWVINPEQRILRVHRALGDLSELVGDAVVTDELVLPGFRCPLPVLFAHPDVAAAT